MQRLLKILTGQEHRELIAACAEASAQLAIELHQIELNMMRRPEHSDPIAVATIGVMQRARPHLRLVSDKRHTNSTQTRGRISPG